VIFIAAILALLVADAVTFLRMGHYERLRQADARRMETQVKACAGGVSTLCANVKEIPRSPWRRK
jgi:hypothetical protein